MFSHSVSSLFACWWLILWCRNILVSCSPSSDSWDYFLCSWSSVWKVLTKPSISKSTPYFFSSSFNISVFKLRSWSISTWFLYKVRGVNLISFFFRGPASFASTIYWIDFFPLLFFVSFVKKLGGHSSVGLFLDPLFCYLGLLVWFYSSTRISLSL